MDIQKEKGGRHDTLRLRMENLGDHAVGKMGLVSRERYAARINRNSYN
jgi:hypothetical protein